MRAKEYSCGNFSWSICGQAPLWWQRKTWCRIPWRFNMAVLTGVVPNSYQQPMMYRRNVNEHTQMSLRMKYSFNCVYKLNNVCRYVSNLFERKVSVVRAHCLNSGGISSLSLCLSSPHTGQHWSGHATADGRAERRGAPDMQRNWQQRQDGRGGRKGRSRQGAHSEWHRRVQQGGCV